MGVDLDLLGRAGTGGGRGVERWGKGQRGSVSRGMLGVTCLFGDGRGVG